MYYHSMNTLKVKFGARIIELRKKNNLSQESFAEMVALDRRSISNIECGNTFPSSSLLKISQALNVELKELFDFDCLEKTDEELIKTIEKRLNHLNTEQLKVIYRLTEVL